MTRRRRSIRNATSRFHDDPEADRKSRRGRLLERRNSARIGRGSPDCGVVRPSGRQADADSARTAPEVAVPGGSGQSRVLPGVQRHDVLLCTRNVRGMPRLPRILDPGSLCDGARSGSARSHLTPASQSPTVANRRFSPAPGADDAHIETMPVRLPRGTARRRSEQRRPRPLR